MRIEIAPSALLIALFACSGGKEPAVPVASGATPAAQQTMEPPARQAIAVPAPKSPAQAYFAIDRRGLVVLEGGAWHTIAGDFGIVMDLAATPDGTLFIAAARGVGRLPKGGERVERDGDFFALDLAVAPDGTVVALTDRGIKLREGGRWTDLTPAAGFGPPAAGGPAGSAPTSPRMRKIAIDSQKRIFAIDDRELYALVKDGTWVPSETVKRFGDRVRANDIQTGANGAVYVLLNTHVLRIHGDPIEVQPISFEGTPIRSPSTVTVSAEGVIYVAGSNQVSVIPPVGSMRHYSNTEGHFSAAYVRRFAVDAGGRIWVPSAESLAVIHERGDGMEPLVIEWPMAQLPALDGEIVNAMLVAGDGPVLPEPPTDVRGAVEGKVLRDGRPVAGATVEACPADPTRAYSAGSPCRDANAKERFSAVTDATGRFRLEGVSPAQMQIAVEQGERWEPVYGVACCMRVLHGETYDIGAIKLRAR